MRVSRPHNLFLEGIEHMAKQWYETIYTYIWIFNIGRGFAAFVRMPQNIGFICDMGASDDFSPRKFIEGYIIPKLNKFTDTNGRKKLHS